MTAAMPSPKPGPPAKRRREHCRCRVCLMAGHTLVHLYRTVIARSYTRDEFRVVTRISHSAMLPRDPRS